MTEAAELPSAVFILGIHRGNIPPPKKKSYIPQKSIKFFFVFGFRIIVTKS